MGNPGSATKAVRNDARLFEVVRESHTAQIRKHFLQGLATAQLCLAGRCGRGRALRASGTDDFANLGELVDIVAV
jgi:hypothetical protein